MIVYFPTLSSQFKMVVTTQGWSPDQQRQQQLETSLEEQNANAQAQTRV